MNIKGAIFDMDGTLIDSLMVWDMIWEDIGVRFLKKDGFRPSKADDRAVRTMTLIDAMTLIHDNYGIAESGEALWRYVTDYIADFYANTVELKKGVREFLDILSEKGVRMCVASATAPDLVKLAIEHCGLEKYLSTLVSCSEIGKGKEHPDVFFAALDRLGTDIDSTWVFEDSAVALETASKAGFHTVGIYDKYNFGHDLARSVSEIYVDDGENLEKVGAMI